MTTTFSSEVPPSRIADELENALLSRAFADTVGGGDPVHKGLLRTWFRGTFNAKAHHLTEIGNGLGELAWMPEGADNHRLLWRAPSGLVCHLAKVYRQEDGSWATLVVAGVKDDLIEALGAAEWAVARLTI